MNKQVLFDAIKQVNPYKRYGKVTRVIGMMIESRGPETSIGNVCILHIGKREKILAEVVGFRDEFVYLMPFTNVTHISPGSLVEDTGKPLEIESRHRINRPGFKRYRTETGRQFIAKRFSLNPTDDHSPNPLKRRRITEPLETGCVRSMSFYQSV